MPTFNWIPVTDRLPEFDLKVIVIWDGEIDLAIYNSAHENWQQYPDGDFAISNEVSHWADCNDLIEG